MRAALLIFFMLLVACHEERAATGALHEARPKDVASNVTRDDYAGSEACRDCHRAIYEKWQASPMHRMTRAAQGADVKAPFEEGAQVAMGGDVARISMEDGARIVRISSSRRADEAFRVTKIIGGRHREDFAGVPLGSASETQDEVVLPVSYVFASKRLRYKGYSVMVRERGEIRAGPVWNKTCVFCHNTQPYLLSLLGVLGASKHRGYQGTTVDALLPDDRRLAYRVTDEDLLRRALEQEMSFLGAPAPEAKPSIPDLLARAIDVTRARFSAGSLVEVGIGCESCHGGAREHVLDQGQLPSYAPRAPFLETRAAQAGDPRAQAENHVCARCHEVLFSQYPFTWEGGHRRGEGQGGSTTNSGEARDLLLGRCQSRLSCTACHDPHGEDSKEALRRLSSPAGNAVCTGCHGALAKEDALTRHSHHRKDSAGSGCVACHMARKNMSLDSGLGVYHRIGSPTDGARVTGDRPLECAVCHGDKSVKAILVTMDAWWGRRYDQGALRNLYGDLEANVLLATLERGKPHEQAVAMALLGERRDRNGALAVARELAHPYPLVREYAKNALTAMFGEEPPVELDADPQAIERAVRAFLTARGVVPPDGPLVRGAPRPPHAEEPSED